MLDARVEAVIIDRVCGRRSRAWRVYFFSLSSSGRGEKLGCQPTIRGLNLAVPEIFNTIEQTGISRWLRESQSIFGFYFILLFHTIGMSLVVGANAVVDLRILGIASDLPLRPLKRLFAIMWTGLGINVTTGLLLLTAYPTKALTNPDFYVKLSFIALAVFIMSRLNTRVFGDASLSEAAMVAKGKIMARWSLVFWIGAVGSGRLLSETARYFFYGHPAGG
jgi:hypothetical protein